MLQHIINKMPATAQVFDPAGFKLKICLEPNAIVLLLQARDGTVHGIEYFAWDEDDNKNLAKTMESLPQQSRLFQCNNLPTTIYYRTENVALVPLKLAADARQILEVQFGFKPNETSLQNQISSDIVAAWKVDLTWHTLLQQQFPNHTFQSSIHNLYQHIEMDKSPTLHLAFGNGLVELIVVSKQLLQMAKCFAYQNVEEMNYHLLNICSQLQIPTEDVQLKVQGMVEINSPLYTSLQFYFSNIQPQTIDNANWPETLKDLPIHYFTGLINAV